VSFVDRDDTLRHCASKKTNGYFVRSLLPTRDVVTAAIKEQVGTLCEPSDASRSGSSKTP